MQVEKLYLAIHMIKMEIQKKYQILQENQHIIPMILQIEYKKYQTIKTTYQEDIHIAQMIALNQYYMVMVYQHIIPMMKIKTYQAS